MAYTQPSPYASHPVQGTIYTTMGGMPHGQAVQYRMLTNEQIHHQQQHQQQLATAAGVPLGASGVAVGRGPPMMMTTNGPAHPPGAPGPAMHNVRYASAPMGMGRAMSNGMIPAPPLGRGMAPGMAPMGYQPVHAGQVRLPPGTRLVTGPGAGNMGHPGHGYTLVNQHGQPISYGIPQGSQPPPQQNPNAPGGHAQPHMLNQQQPQPGGPGGQGQKIYQQPSFTQMGPGTMHTVSMALPPSGGSPVRHTSPNAATPASAPTPGGPGRGAGPNKPPTPANASYPPNASTPGASGARPGTASGQNQNPASYSHGTPRMHPVDQASPGSMQRNPVTGPPGGMQQQNMQPAQQQQQPGGPPPSGGPGGPGIDPSGMYRPTPVQRVEEQNRQMYGGPGSSTGQGQQASGQGPMEGVRYGGMNMIGGPGQPGGGGQPQQRQGPVQGQGMLPPQSGGMMPMQTMPPLQQQLTGGSVSSMPLVPQLTGGNGGPNMRPLGPQHTGGSIQDTLMNGPGGPPPGPGAGPGRGSVPSTPQNRPVSMAGPSPGLGPGAMQMSMGPSGYSMIPPPNGGHGIAAAAPGEMRPPSLPQDPFRSMPMELGAVSTMGSGMMAGQHSRQTFGVLRLLQFSSQLRELSGYDCDRWSPIIRENFTNNATLTFRARAQQETRMPLNTFVTLPFPLLIRFFATLTQSGVNRMSFALDGAVESQQGHEYTVHCDSARWPMHYDNGHILELNGVLQVKCRPVPAFDPLSNTTPRLSSTVPNGLGSSPSGSSNNMNASPTNPPSAMPNGVEQKSQMPLSGVPYMVKIDELTFDSIHVTKLFDLAFLQGTSISKEPDNVFGVPKLTMRMVEIAEGTQAMEPLMEHAEKMARAEQTTYAPLEAFKTLAHTWKDAKENEQHVRVSIEGQPATWMLLRDATTLAQARGGLYVGENSPPLSALSANVTQRLSNSNDHNNPEAANSNTDPSVSPSIQPKTPKKNTTPGSPIKAAAAGPTEKEKSAGKRKNTVDEGGPPSKRRMPPRKGSAAKGA